MGFLAGLGSAAIGAGSSLFGSLFGNSLTRGNMRLANQLNKDLFDYTFGKQADYNNPLAQVGRLKAAGLNPALAVAGGVGNTIQGATSSSNAPSAVGPDVAEKAAQTTLLTEQIGNVKADTKQKESAAALNDANKEVAEQNAVKARYDILSSKYESQLKQLDVAIKSEASPEIIKNLKLQVQRTAADIQMLTNQAAQFGANAREANARAAVEEFTRDVLQPLQEKIGMSEVNLKNAQAILAHAMAALSNAQAWQIRQLTPAMKDKLNAEITELFARAGKEKLDAENPGIVGSTYRSIKTMLKDAADAASKYYKQYTMPTNPALKPDAASSDYKFDALLNSFDNSPY